MNAFVPTTSMTSPVRMSNEKRASGVASSGELGPRLAGADVGVGALQAGDGDLGEDVVGHPRILARPAVFLLSHESASVTGPTSVMDVGRTTI